jgi:hypothetical protein
MISSEKELEYSIQCLAKMYRLRDREAAETHWDAETREDVVEGTMSAIRKVEREVAEYLAKKYEVAPATAETVA